ncbi:UvrD-helicase domain-containing protein [Noviherbaspirillum sp.]|uniref:UvrD-helicase domain-containing protein n=1 Tax=Noviherbaspirillum sp. TaxID=1926288 RepID=UPI002B49F859|nr:UvrD-helicase domain-containing protein [Noviherbaspirillum sp.]HJV81718.1 UvrD-helicase domain-containing protein [Noviherbaspirillum sp.]
MRTQTGSPRAYEANGQAVDAMQFTRIACNPARSVVVEACAGSGKTWLLVARMLRLLLAGAEPSELLAITFTRKAAQEMRERLLQLLHELALQPEHAVRDLLLERGIDEADLPRVLPAARTLYERVLASPQSLSIDTFHSWFARLVQIAPLASGVPHGYTLTEATGELLMDAYSRFMQALNADDQRDVRQALMSLYEMVGDWNARRLLDAFVDKRAEWWAITQDGQHVPLEWLRELCGDDGIADARLSLWNDRKLQARVSKLASLLGRGTAVNQKRATAIEKALSAGASIEAFDALCHEFFGSDGDARKNQKTKDLTKALEQALGSDGCNVFDAEFEAIGEELKQLRKRSFECQVLALNEALFAAGNAYLAHYQAVKAEQRVFDFGDLEWHAYRLLTDEGHAAYLQSRLDSRYRHILLDEFQDTNPLQWSIVRAWLAAYGDDAQKPSVFVVGDPKQSIYRFRRAEPRVFIAARDMLAQLGADVLRTNQTRRNAASIIEVLNASFTANPIFSPQTTLGAPGGMVWRLPLIRAAENEEAAATAFSLRDPLSTPRPEEEDERRVEEGRAVARAIVNAMRELTAKGAPAKWSDVMLLVKKRSYLTAYESALREAGIPFVSGKRGGLLESLEVADLIALLSFLITPGDNRALAHVLKSPVFGASDDDLIALAQRSEPAWWERMQAAADASPAIRRAVQLLRQWLDAAPRLPVHDLIDVILHQGELVARYAQAAQPVVRAQVLGNIEAFTELALNLDSGRYPSLPKFIDALRLLKKGAESEAPDEAAVDAAVDAVRILTIHSAKGLEAPIVVMVDTNHSEPARDDCGILCDWPQDADAPTHFSCFGRRQERGAARDALFAAEEAFKQQEDWNLLYVGITRAKHILIVSGVAGARGTLEDGVMEGSWYHRLQNVPTTVFEAEVELASDGVAGNAEFSIPVFNPPLLGERKEAAAPQSIAIDEGIALHALLERLTNLSKWPICVPDAIQIARWLRCTLAMAITVREHAVQVLSRPDLERFFNPTHFHFARNEMEVMAGDELLRFDRAVVCYDEVWILDYKRDLLDSERTLYRQQLSRYRLAATQVFPGKTLRTALITADGKLWEME